MADFIEGNISFMWTIDNDSDHEKTLFWDWCTYMLFTQYSINSRYMYAYAGQEL